MATYVMSDLHGELKKFEKMLEVIQFSDSDKMFILGDVIDRGAEPIALLQKVMNMKNVTLLLGNHEDMMVHGVRDRDEEYLSAWLSNGGVVTWQQFSILPVEEQLEIIKYLGSLPISEYVNNFILVHAGVKVDHNGSIEKEQDGVFMLWARKEFYEQDIADTQKTVIFGHTPTHYISDAGSCSIWKEKPNMICIDCGANFERMACLRLDDMKEFYV